MSEERLNEIRAFGAVVGLSREEILRIEEVVKRNTAKLESCQLHRFVEQTHGKLMGYSVCESCGGRVGSSQARWYQLGLEHAAQNGSDQR